MAAMVAYPWPGNVRELENVIERTVVLADGDEVGPHDLPLVFDAGGEQVLPGQEPGGEKSLTAELDALERRRIVEAMEKAGQVKTRAAEILGIKTSALYYKLEKHGLE
jgi:two-component system response regulator HydG